MGFVDDEDFVAVARRAEADVLAQLAHFVDAAVGGGVDFNDVDGAAAGAGMGLACACDLVLAAESAKFTMAYSKIGLSPDGSTTYFLPRRVGIGRAM